MRAFILLPLFVFAYVAWILSIGFDFTLLDMHGFRQTQTAISVWAMKSGHLLFYETPVLGAPFSIPFELPVYHWFVLGVNLIGIPLDQAGRVVSIAFFVVSIFGLYRLLSRFEPLERFFILLPFIVSPHYLFWSRTFLIESVALAVSIWFLVLCNSYRGLFFAFLAPAKATTFLPILFVSGVKFLVKPKKALFLNLCVSFLSIVLWTKYTDHLKTLNPQTNGFLTSEALWDWTFGGDRLSSQFWVEIFWNRIIPDLLGNHWVLLLLPFGIFNSRFRFFVLVNLSLFILPLLVFMNVHKVHNYYQYANGVFLLLALGASSLGFFRKHYLLAALFLPIMLYSSYRGYHERFVPYIWNAGSDQTSLTRYIRNNTKPEEYIIIFGQDWSPEIPYYARRKALMNRTGVIDESFMNSIALTGKATKGLGAVVFCNHPPNDSILNLLGTSSLTESGNCKVFTRAN